MKQIQVIFLLIFVLTAHTAKADSWFDPSWKQMLSGSEAVIQAEYVTDGKYGAFAKVLKVYKGNLRAGEEVYIAGYSNRYGPVDQMHVGDKYIVFLSANKPTEEYLTSFQNEIAEKPNDAELKRRYEKYRNGRSYFVSSPTSGDLKVESDTVQYVLTQTTYFEDQPWYSLTEFEDFLFAYYNKEKRKKIYNSLLQKLDKTNDSEQPAQYLMMLALLDYDLYNKKFKVFITAKEPAVRFALAALMGNIHTAESRETLVKLLEDEHTIVQGEAVRQLKAEPVEIAGPILLQHLQTASPENYTTSIMNPVLNRVAGGKTEILNALAEMKYKPAIPYLLPMLTTGDDDVFERTVEILRSMGSREYAPYITKYLEEGPDEMAYEAAEVVAADSLAECLPALRSYISRFNRDTNEHYHYYELISILSNFDTQENRDFLLDDFRRFSTAKDTMTAINEYEWAKRYIYAFMYLKLPEAKPLIYKCFFDWTGINQNFVKNPKLFRIKDDLENKFHIDFAEKLGAEGYILNHKRAFIQNGDEVVKGKKPEVKYIAEIVIPVTHGGDAGMHMTKLSRGLNLPQSSLRLVFSDNMHYLTTEQRFHTHIMSTFISAFFEYLISQPSKQDLDFLTGLQKSNYFTDAQFNEALSKAIVAINGKMK